MESQGERNVLFEGVQFDSIINPHYNKKYSRTGNQGFADYFNNQRKYEI